MRSLWLPPLAASALLHLTLAGATGIALNKGAFLLRKSPTSVTVLLTEKAGIRADRPSAHESAPARRATPPEPGPVSEAAPSSPAQAQADRVEETPADTETATAAPQANGVIRLLEPIRPNYPRVSRARGEEGEVTLRIQIAANGTVESALVQRSSGFPHLDAAALESAEKARFQLPMGLPEEVRSRDLTIHFRLTDHP